MRSDCKVLLNTSDAIKEMVPVTTGKPGGPPILHFVSRINPDDEFVPVPFLPQRDDDLVGANGELEQLRITGQFRPTGSEPQIIDFVGAGNPPFYGDEYVDVIDMVGQLGQLPDGAEIGYWISEKTLVVTLGVFHLGIPESGNADA